MIDLLILIKRNQLARETQNCRISRFVPKQKIDCCIQDLSTDDRTVALSIKMMEEKYGFTWDETLAIILKCQTCFTKTCHSWERSQEENANGLLATVFAHNKRTSGGSQSAGTPSCSCQLKNREMLGISNSL